MFQWEENRKTLLRKTRHNVYCKGDSKENITEKIYVSEWNKEYLVSNFNYTLEYEVNNFLVSVAAFWVCIAAVQILLEIYKTGAYNPRRSVYP